MIKFTAHDIAASPALINRPWKIGKRVMDCLGYTCSGKTVRFATLEPDGPELKFIMRYIEPNKILECADEDGICYADWPDVAIPNFLKLDGWTHKDLLHCQSNPCSYTYINEGMDHFQIVVFVGAMDDDPDRNKIEIYFYSKRVESTISVSREQAGMCIKNILAYPHKNKITQSNIESIARGEYNGIK